MFGIKKYKIILLLTLTTFIPTFTFAGRNLEDFTTYSETDTANRFTVTSTKLTVTDADRDENCFLYKDKTANFFSSDFEHWFTISNTANALFVGTFYALTNDVGSMNLWTHNYIRFYIYNNNTFDLQEYYNTSTYYDGVTLNSDTPYYFKIIRDEDIGTYGTLYAYIYSDSDRTTLVDTLAVTLHSKEDYQYIYAGACPNDGNTGRDWDGFIENLSLSESAPTPTPTQTETPTSGSSSNPSIFVASFMGFWAILATIFILLKNTKSLV